MSAEEKREAIEDIFEEMQYYVQDISVLKRYADLPARSGLPLAEVVDIMRK